MAARLWQSANGGALVVEAVLRYNSRLTNLPATEYIHCKVY